MDNRTFEDFENDLASHLKPVRDGEQRWAKAMKLIEHFVEARVREERERCAKVGDEMYATAGRGEQYQDGYNNGTRDAARKIRALT